MFCQCDPVDVKLLTWARARRSVLWLALVLQTRICRQSCRVPSRTGKGCWIKSIPPALVRSAIDKEGSPSCE